MLPNVAPGVIVQPEDIGILDSRCEACTNDYGVFKDMSMFVNDNISNDSAEQKALLEKAEYKMDKFIDVVLLDHPTAFFGNNISSDEIATKRDEKIASLGIDDLLNSEKIDLVERYKENNKDDKEIDPSKAETIKQEIISEREPEE